MILPTATVLGLVLTAALLGSGVAIAAPPALAEATTPARVAHRLPPLLNPLPAPDQDEFYRPPSDVTGYQPGQIIRSRPGRALLDPRTRVVPSRAWQILYRSTTATGHPTDREFALIYHAVARGWAVVVTDHEGLGTPGHHTYFGRTSARGPNPRREVT